MGWIRFTGAVLAGGGVANMTDWLFMGDSLYKRFDKHPEIWRFRSGQGESAAIAWSALLPFFTCALFDFLCLSFTALNRTSMFELAVGVWLAVALPLIAANAIWMKLSAPIAVSFSIGWLVKLLVAALSLMLMVK